MEDFLKKRYELHNTPEAKKAARRTEVRTSERVPQNPDTQIQNYLNRFKEIIERDDPQKKERGLRALKKVLDDAFITKPKDIPPQFWQQQENILRERGLGADWEKADEEEKKRAREETTEGLLDDQRASLEHWIDYFASDDSSYMPDAMKYWVFRNITKLQEYDKQQHKFPKRSKGTMKMFPDINHEALSYVIDAVVKKYTGKGSSEFGYDIQPEERKEFERYLAVENFAKLYGWANELIAPVPEHLLKETRGVWKTYEQGSDHMPLVRSIQRKGTGWCTAGETTAARHLEGGDFHVYYTLDEEGSSTIPRIAIRMEGDHIAEVRGVAHQQNLDPYIGEILHEKLGGFPDKDEYLKKESDMRRLTEIDNAVVKGSALSKDDLRFLYEIDGPIRGFGYQKDPRIIEILIRRDMRDDIADIFDTTPDRISTTKKEALSGDTVFHYGDLSLRNFTSAEGLTLPKTIGGHLDLSNLTSAEGLTLPESIGGDIDLSSLTSAEGLTLPQSIGGSLDLGSLTSAEGLTLPKSIGYYIDLRSLTAEKKESLRARYPHLARKIR